MIFIREVVKKKHGYFTVRLTVREAILQKITEFYEIISQTGGGSTGFHISYSEMLRLK